MWSSFKIPERSWQASPSAQGESDRRGVPQQRMKNLRVLHGPLNQLTSQSKRFHDRYFATSAE